MKRRISDLLDGIREDSIDLREPTPLSSDRIKELTMGKFEPKTNQKKQGRGRRIAFRILVAAAILAMLPVTVYAAEAIFGAGDWFRGRMNDQLKEDQALAAENDWDIAIQETVSQGQVDVANKLGQNFKEQTVTSNGTTMTMTAAYGDEYVLHLYLKVETPEGTVLPDGVIYKFFDWNDVRFEGDNPWRPLVPGEGAPYDQTNAQITSITPLPDNDPADNKKDFDIVLTRQYIPDYIADEEGIDCRDKFNDGISKLLSFTGIYEQVVNMNGDEDGYVPFATGDFTFDIGLINDVEVIDIDVAGMNYGGHAERTWSHPDNPDQHYEWCPPYDENGVHTEEWDFTVTPRSLQISPMTVRFDNDYTCTMGNGMAYYMAFRIVMKDGTSPMMKDNGGFLSETRSCAMKTFTTPIDLSQIDYIEIGDPDVCEPYKIDMN